MINFCTHIACSTWKEILLLSRDKAGLVVLFFMPAALVVIITLVQENVMELTGEKKSEILFYDEDGGRVGEQIRLFFEQSARITLVEVDTAKLLRDEARSLVNSGEYQVCVIIPEGTSELLTYKAASLFKDDEESVVPLSLPLLFDPSVLPGFRSGISAMLQMTLFRVEMELKIEALQKRLQQQLEVQNLPAPESVPDLQKHILADNLIELQLEESSDIVRDPPSAVQRNIPAWALFGLFFTCIPLAGSLLTERNSGLWIRLMSMPASAGALLSGKMLAYVGVCFCQIVLIVILGIYLFPFLGLPSFFLSGNICLLLVISLCCALAACSYGVFLGAVCSSLEQASMFGSISIVIASSLGGTLVPTYAMPAIMQRISIFSPLNWGLTSYEDVLLRGFSFIQIGGNLALLLLFFLGMLLFSWRIARRPA